MAHPLVWPGKYFFYPIGNTSAVCLTRDLPPEEPANILLLGCGDSRNVLYTIFCEPQFMNRPLDFTCCDFDPGILARDVLLLTLVADKKPYATTIWNIFFHIYIDDEAHTTLIEHCKKLVALSDDLRTWNESPYGRFIKMCTEHTLAELQRYWSLYVHMRNLPAARIQSIRDAFTTVFKPSLERWRNGVVFSAARSAGPLMGKAAPVTTDQCLNYWTKGVTFTSPQQLASATILNPTFVYSRAGEGCSVHYATDPLAPFHTAALFSKKKGATVSDLVGAAKAEFGDWCAAFQSSTSQNIIKPPIIRFFLGDAMAVCSALHAFSATGTLKLGIPVSQWNTHLIQLNKDDYLSKQAPARFNVIETSNLDDHIGLLNVLTAAVPLLSAATQSAVLYTESLLYMGQDATKEFTERLYANLTIIGLLIGICPVDYLSGFTTRSNIHELILHRVCKGELSQFHQVTTWKSPISGDVSAPGQGGGNLPPIFDSCQLGTMLYDMYHQLFEHEDAKHFFRLNQDNLMKAIAMSNIIHYIRTSFVLFLKLIRDNLHIAEHQWLDIMDRFFDLEDADQSLPMDTVNYQDLCGQLHYHGVYTVSVYQRERLPKIGRLSFWENIPPLVRIILVVPRIKLAVLDSEKVSTPLLHCDVRGSWSHNIFSAVHVAFGTVISIGTKAHPKVLFEEDAQGWEGLSPLVASFTMPTRLLTSIEPMEKLNVYLSMRSTPATMLFTSQLGPYLNIFGVSLTDETAVHVLPEPPLPVKRASAISPPARISTLSSQIGRSSAATVELDEQCEVIVNLASKVLIEKDEVKALLVSGAVPEVSQTSPCVLNIVLGEHRQDVVFPFPVVGSLCKLRVARKSLYIEPVVPAFGPLKPDGMKINPFPVIKTLNGNFTPWSVHRLNLARLPTLAAKATSLGDWLNPHVGAMLSSRERSIRKKHENDTLTLVKDTIHTIFVRSAGIQGGPAQRLFALADKMTKNCDTILFVSDLRFDLHSHTVICDAYVLPLTHLVLPKIETMLTELVQHGNICQVPLPEGEVRALKQLMPALVERCRSSWMHAENCEYKVQGQIPLTNAMEQDPLCNCGRGKNVEGMHRVPLWSKLAPYVTRIALSPLFAVSYLETVGRDPARYMCFVCRGKGKPKLMTCSACQKVRYCSKICQKKDWNKHKQRCKS